MAKEKKNYTSKIVDGRMELVLNELRDGRRVSASCPYPLVIREYNEESGKTLMIRKSKKQTEKFLLETLGLKA